MAVVVVAVEVGGVVIGVLLCVLLRSVGGRLLLGAGFALVAAAQVGGNGWLVPGARGVAEVALEVALTAVTGLGFGLILAGGVRSAARRVGRAPAQSSRRGAPLVMTLALRQLPPVHVDAPALMMLGAGFALLANVGSLILGGRPLPAAGTLLLVPAACLCVAAHEGGHLLAAVRFRWPVDSVWIGLGGAVSSELTGRPTASSQVMLVGAAGPAAAALAGAALGGLLLVFAGSAAAWAVLAFGAGLMGLLQLAFSTDAVFVGRGALALLRGWRVVLMDGDDLSLRPWIPDLASASGDRGARPDTSR